MSRKRRVEIFSAGCRTCEATVEQIRGIACPSCEVTVLDMHDPEVARRAADIGVRSVPAVAIDGVLAGCCSGRGPDVAVLLAAGLGKPIA